MLNGQIKQDLNLLQNKIKRLRIDSKYDAKNFKVLLNNGITWNENMVKNKEVKYCTTVQYWFIVNLDM